MTSKPTYQELLQKIIEQEKEIEQQPENSDNETASIENLTLLIVEDDELSSKLLETILKDTFHNIMFATNGIDAIELCKNNLDINLILMDTRMPRMDGITSMREIRKFNKDVIIISQTAYAMYGDREKMIAWGYDDYISKPIDSNELLNMITKYLKIIKTKDNKSSKIL